MQNLIVIFFFLTVLTSGHWVKAGTVHPGTKADTGIIRLFNGVDLDGWYTFLKGRGKNLDPKQVFTVKQGMLHISGEEWGCITTNNIYQDYTLVVEYKWGKKTWAPRKDNARDGGILVHSNGEDGGYSGTWMHGIECQIIEGGSGDMLVVGDGSKKFSLTCKVAADKQKSSYVFSEYGKDTATISGGRINWWGRDAGWQDSLGFRGKQDLEKPVGEWNKMECVVRGREISVYLNGVLANRALEVYPTSGRIQIQSEAAEMLIKNIYIIPLAPVR